MSSKRKLISTLLCVGALTAGLFVSGCGSEKAADTVSSAVSSATDTKSDEKVSKAFNEIIDATNKFNGNNTTWGQQHAENLTKLKAGFDEHAINTQPKYDSLQNGLKKSKEIGNTYKEVDTERDNVLAALDDVAAVEKFNAAYGKLGDAVKAANKEQTKKNLEKMKKDGYKNYAAAMEATLRLTDLVDKVEATQSNPDKAGVEKELGEIQVLLNGIDTKDSYKESLVRNFNDTVGAIRQVMADPNDKYQDRNLNRMVQSFNHYIDVYNRIKPDSFDEKKK